MNISKREFMQVLGAASVAAWRWAAMRRPTPATAQQGLYDLPRFTAMCRSCT